MSVEVLELGNFLFSVLYVDNRYLYICICMIKYVFFIFYGKNICFIMDFFFWYLIEYYNICKFDLYVVFYVCFVFIGEIC